MSEQIVQVVVGLPVEGPFDYTVPVGVGALRPGMRVRVPFGPRSCLGVVVGTGDRKNAQDLRSVEDILDERPVVDELPLRLCRELAGYYDCSLGEAIEMILPDALRQPRKVDGPAEQFSEPPAPGAIVERELLLFHDPGRSQAWASLLERIKKTVAAGRGVIVLVPEKVLIAGVVKKLEPDFAGRMVELDKRLSSAKELENWFAVKTGRAAIAVGTRSAVFAPFARLGLVVMTEEEHSAYKQEQSPHYHARDVVLLRARLENASAIFVSDVPSAELWWAARKKMLKLVSFEVPPESVWQLIDLTNYNRKKTSVLSVPLQNAITKTIAARGKVLLWLNRKGFSSSTRCQKCGFSLKCPHCDVNLMYSYSKKKMVCRRCRKKSDFPPVCPECRSSYLRSHGIGVEKLESEVARLFPQARVEHFDAESEALPKTFDILIATAAVMKSLAERPFDLIGVVQVDAELNRLDFRGTQRAFAVLTHLRFGARQKLIVQTRLAEHYCLRYAKCPDFRKFYREELRQRKDLEFPPEANLLSVGFRSVKEDAAARCANSFFEALTRKTPKGVSAIEPHPDVVAKLRDKYRFTVLMKGKSSETLLKCYHKAIKAVSRNRGVIVTMNPDYSPSVFL